MARPPLPLLGSTVLPRPPTHLPFTRREIASSRPRTLLPHFSSSNACSSKAPGRSQPEDFSKTPLEKSIDELKRVKARVRDSFTRMNQTQEQFDLDLEEASRIVNSLEAEQRYLSQVYANLLDFSARQIQRCFRGHTGRRLFRQALVVRAVLRVQHKFREFHRRREETRKKSRVMYRKVLRGLRGVRERDELSHAELLNRVGHNLQVESQWRKAMGVEDTESDLITALYRKKYVRGKLGAMFRQLYWVHSVGMYWKSLLPQPEPINPVESDVQESEQIDEQVDELTFELAEMNGNGLEGVDSSSEHKIVIVAPPRRKQNGAGKRFNRGSHRDELLHRQKMTMREIKAKKDDELRKEEETIKRIVQAKKKSDTHSERTQRSTHKGGQR
ncbi:hypothetical protein F441_10718 [Phytophthora nicotianae CJ01A1]|uniref:Uncharacterized protein n=3 Tax=Phytophthora nicotianae TaxID=4792 RepID=V9F0A2_PHYNI|nr:hypothetical protein F443_10792 [Phytophthora nicotianae P1569]ETK84495.1 hypothetical protein L915_10535 [Phytophthora nicotianae]ETL37936.1 hypothetical protein L916_10424 [Phytophthora nicotianae]ETL91076.1 hypothetical protein L917_10347 [Phytophthora nicotianae]ETP14306.1 hypothetical protein F441_10718 [Phytophthora nicotianae CJ01A1]